MLIEALGIDVMNFRHDGRLIAITAARAAE
jgi:hypothetical protein